MKPKSDWSEVHTRLKALYDERAPKGMTQKDFGKAYGIGSQSMVAQYLNGDRPLNFEAAAKFAKGLRCTIHDFSPEMAEALKADIMPVLGPRAWLRSAGVKASLAGFAALPFIEALAGCVLCKIPRRAVT